jgi:hypothetical protein
VHKSEKKEVCGQPAVEARARARDGSRGTSRWSARWGDRELREPQWPSAMAAERVSLGTGTGAGCLPAA